MFSFNWTKEEWYVILRTIFFHFLFVFDWWAVLFLKISVNEKNCFINQTLTSSKHHLKWLVQKVLPPFSDDIILCTIHVLDFYPNIPHDKGLITMSKALDLEKDKTISSDSLTEVVECVFLKNKILEHNLLFYTQLRGTVICTKMTPLYAFIFWVILKKHSVVIVTIRLYFVGAL